MPELEAFYQVFHEKAGICRNSQTTKRPKMLEFPGFCDSQAEHVGIPKCTTRLETLEFVGFLWTTCLKMLEFPRPPFCGPCCALPNDAMCAKIAIGTWKTTTTCVGAQTRSRRFACRRPLPGWWSRGREVTCSGDFFSGCIV